MPKVVRKIDTGEFIYRSIPEFLPGMGISNASAIYGINPSNLEEISVTEEEWSLYRQNLPLYKKQSDIDVNLPSWEQVRTAIQNANTLDEFRTIIMKIARVLYWLARDSET